MSQPAAKWALRNLSLIVGSLVSSKSACSEMESWRYGRPAVMPSRSPHPCRWEKKPRERKHGVYSKLNLHNSRESNHSWLVLHSWNTEDSATEFKHQFTTTCVNKLSCLLWKRNSTWCPWMSQQSKWSKWRAREMVQNNMIPDTELLAPMRCN